jgi:hypothetical protein
MIYDKDGSGMDEPEEIPQPDSSGNCVKYGVWNINVPKTFPTPSIEWKVRGLHRSTCGDLKGYLCEWAP